MGLGPRLEDGGGKRACPRADVEHRLAVLHAGEVDEQRRETPAPAAHEGLVGVALREHGRPRRNRELKGWAEGRYSIAPAGLGVQTRFGLAAMTPAACEPRGGLGVIPKNLLNSWAKCAVVIGEMYATFRPRLGVLHFTLAIVFFPFGAPQAQSVPARVRPTLSVPAPATVLRSAPRPPREIFGCSAR